MRFYYNLTGVDEDRHPFEGEDSGGFTGILGYIPQLINQITALCLLDAGKVASMKGGLLALNSSLLQFSLPVSEGIRRKGVLSS